MLIPIFPLLEGVKLTLSKIKELSSKKSGHNSSSSTNNLTVLRSRKRRFRPFTINNNSLKIEPLKMEVKLQTIVNLIASSTILMIIT